MNPDVDYNLAQQNLFRFLSVIFIDFLFVFFDDLVVIARGTHPIPSRTRPWRPSAPMVLHLKVWESRSPPGLRNSENRKTRDYFKRLPQEDKLHFLLTMPKNSVERTALKEQRWKNSVERTVSRTHLPTHARAMQTSRTKSDPWSLTSDPWLPRGGAAR